MKRAPIDLDEFRARVQGGMDSNDALMAHYELSRRQISVWRKRAGVSAAPDRLTVAQREKIEDEIRLLDPSDSLLALAKKYNSTGPNMRRIRGNMRRREAAAAEKLSPADKKHRAGLLAEARARLERERNSKNGD